MRRLRTTRYLPFLGLLLATLPGCFTYHSYRPVPVLIRDAETKKAIQGAEVSLWYPLGSHYSVPPDDAAGVTGSDGVVQLTAAPFGEAGLMLAGKAKGYLPETLNVATETIEKFEAKRAFKKKGIPGEPLVVELFAEPRPIIELIVPTGFRGLVHVKLIPQDNVPWPAGQRTFNGTMQSSGGVEVRIPSRLRRFFPLDYQAKYANNTLLPRKVKPDEIGLRWLRTNQDEEYFVVGTKLDYDYMRSLRQPDARGGSAGPGQEDSHKHKRGNHSSSKDNN